MAGIIYYCLFILLGILYSDALFKEKNVYFKLWSGGVLGNCALMFAVVPFACLFGFGMGAHIAALLAVAIGYAAIAKRPRFVSKPKYSGYVWPVLGISLLICVLFANHIMVKVPGGVAAGQSTYGDLAMHMGFAESIAEQGKFPPEYNLLAGNRLCYPFLIDSLSASLIVFGTSLRNGFLLPSFCFAFLLVGGFWFLAEKLTDNRKSALIALIIFFLGGGLGFAYFFDGAKAEPQIFTRFLSEYYKTPTNFNGYNIRWANPICDMIIPQRTTMAGWCVLFFALWLLADALKNKDRKDYVLLGIIAGMMPMIHTHSFLALGIFSAAMFFVFLIKEKDKKSYVKNWCLYGFITLAMAIPQLYFWTFSQSVGNSQFVRFGINWVNRDDPYLWFWLKNWGITAIFVLPAILAANKFSKRFSIGAVLIFLIAEVLIFQPNEYDNNKLFFVSYAVFVILTSDYLYKIYVALKGIPGRNFLAAVVVFVSILSGVMSLVREYKSGGDYITFTDGEIEFAEFVRENTPADACFATGNNHLNPVSVLAGRNIYAGSELYVYYHGYAEEMYKRYAEIRDMYKAENVDDIIEFAQKNNISYILLTEYEYENYRVNSEVFELLESVYDSGNIKLYAAKIK